MSPLHTYQRRLTNDELESALEDVHLYLISRRPRTTVRVESQPPGLNRLVATVQQQVPGKEREYETAEVSSPVVHHSGAYWEGSLAGERVHGEAWHLAALLSGRESSVSTHEVLYVGRAYSEDGGRHVANRTSNHSTLQKIYETHHASEWDIFITPLIVEEMLSFNDDHIDDFDEGLAGGLFESELEGDRAEIAKSTVYVVEHLLIAYFVPGYNRQLLQWGEAKHMAPFRESGFRLFVVQLQSLHDLTRFFSKRRPEALTHAIFAEIPGIQSSTGFGIGTSEELGESSTLISPILHSVGRSIAGQAQLSPGLLNVFGDYGPVDNPDFSAWEDV